MTDVINRRSFPRRKLDLAFDLILNGEIVPAVMTDYSLSGMAFLIKGKKIYFKDGEMVFSSSDYEQEQLGAMLLASGKI